MLSTAEPFPCFYCGATRLVLWAERVEDWLKYVPGSWSYLRCEQCGSVHLSPLPKKEEVASLYPPIYNFRTDFGSKSLFKRMFAAIEKRSFYRLLSRGEVKRVKRFTGITSGKLLDVGCGTGDRLTRFATAGFNVRGLEIQSDLVDYIRQNLALEADSGTLDTVAYPSDSFDIVTIHWVIEHLLDVKSVLQKIFTALKPNGWIVAEVPLSDSFQSKCLGRFWSQYREAPRHLGIPSRAGIHQALIACGFVDVKIRPSSIMTCASLFALSMIPNGTAAHAYNNPGWGAYLPRLAAAFLTVIYLPVAALENYILHRPACGLIFARKPA